MSKQDIINKYKDKPIASKTYGDGGDIYVERFIGNSFLYRMYEMDCGEIILTDDGLKFLEEYYGLDAIAELIINRNKAGVGYKYTEKKDIIQWLKNKGY